MGDQLDVKYQRRRHQAPWDTQFSDAVKLSWATWEEKQARWGLGEQGAPELVLDLMFWSPQDSQLEISHPYMPLSVAMGADCNIKQTVIGGQGPPDLEAQL